ncbi:MAG: peptidoglycan-binding protein [Deltaproteobacteria bacterium]|nr:peptidoglycan-binding protein [Deltaproteobacteria bacterium]MBT6433479.1 peptidoglycan-binding protein [Deltaproteobacteria bacterium]MBT6492124.1 peptidoglycan-binding protein [Deltaproteobacteria bacterium]
MNREAFVEQFKTAGVRVDAASSEAAISGSVSSKLRHADLNGDGKISGASEASRLFDGLDNYDRNGSDHSFTTEKSGRETALGKVVKALSRHPVRSQAPNNNQRISIPLQAVIKGLMTIGMGDQGANVSALQEALLKAGISVTVDGDFGPGTLRAVKEFQGKEGLTPDGVVVWGRTGVSPHGHISIALGDGREASDHIDVQRTQLRGHTNVRVFMPS